MCDRTLKDLDWTREYLALGLIAILAIVVLIGIEKIQSEVEEEPNEPAVQETLASVGFDVMRLEATDLPGIVRIENPHGVVYHASVDGVHVFAGPLLRVSDLMSDAPAPIASNEAGLRTRRFLEGRDFHPLPESHRSKASTEPPVEIIEFFSYGCVFCYRLEPALIEWLEETGDSVRFLRIPLAFSTGWESLAKAYYVAEHFDIVDQMHDRLFEAVHETKLVLDDKWKLAAQFKASGTAQSGMVEKLFDSDEIGEMVKSGVEQARNYGINAVPAIVVGGTYVVYPRDRRSFDVVDFLIAEVGVEMSPASDE